MLERKDVPSTSQHMSNKAINFYGNLKKLLTENLSKTICDLENFMNIKSTAVALQCLDIVTRNINLEIGGHRADCVHFPLTSHEKLGKLFAQNFSSIVKPLIPYDLGKILNMAIFIYTSTGLDHFKKIREACRGRLETEMQIECFVAQEKAYQLRKKDQDVPAPATTKDKGADVVLVDLLNEIKKMSVMITSDIEQCTKLLLDYSSSPEFFVYNAVEVLKLKFNEHLFTKVFFRFKTNTQKTEDLIKYFSEFSLYVNSVKNRFESFFSLPFLPFYLFKNLVIYSPQMPPNCFTLKFFIDTIVNKKYLVELLTSEEVSIYTELRRLAVRYKNLKNARQAFFLLFLMLCAPNGCLKENLRYQVDSIDFFVSLFWTLQADDIKSAISNSSNNMDDFDLSRDFPDASPADVISDYFALMRSSNNDCSEEELLRKNRLYAKDAEIASFYLNQVFQVFKNKWFSSLSVNMSKLTFSPKKFLFALLELHVSSKHHRIILLTKMLKTECTPGCYEDDGVCHNRGNLPLVENNPQHYHWFSSNIKGKWRRKLIRKLKYFGSSTAEWRSKVFFINNFDRFVFDVPIDYVVDRFRNDRVWVVRKEIDKLIMKNSSM